MTLATMADRTLPLAERVEAWYWSERTDRGAIGYQDAVDELLADIAAADRLARAADGWSEDDSGHEELVEYNRTLAAYRARMAQGVG